MAIEEEGKIIALIVPNKEAIAENNIPQTELENLFQEVLNEVNEQLPAYSRLTSFQLREEEFEKTPKRSIKRFLYQS